MDAIEKLLAWLAFGGAAGALATVVASSFYDGKLFFAIINNPEGTLAIPTIAGAVCAGAAYLARR